MGLFNLFKNKKDSIKVDLDAIIKKQLEREASFLQMSAAELSELDDCELSNAVQVRTESMVFSKSDMAEGFCALNEEQRIFYAINCLEMEVYNGGLCQFFVNSSGMFAPLVSEYMEIIGATEHKKLYDTFLEKHHIDVSDLSSFDCESVDLFQSQYERYPFDEYDSAFCDLEPLQNFLTAFIKEHIDSF